MAIILGLFLCGCTAVNKDVAGKKAQEYLSKNILKQGIEANVLDVKEENGAYTVSIKIIQEGKEVDKVKVYVTKDGQNLALAPIFNMNKPPATAEQTQKAAAADIPKKEKPEVRLFVMTGCPFGLQAEAAFMPVMKALKDKVDFVPQYIIYSGYQGGGKEYCIDKDSKYCSMHGAEEAREGVRQICIFNEQKEKWWDYVAKFNEKCQINAETPECSKKVAKEVGVDFAKVEKCSSSQSSQLLDKELKAAEKFNASGSPTIVINGSNYEGSRAPNDILTAICSGFTNKPEECNVKLANGDAAPAAQGGCGR